jgi:ribosomal protein S27AE
VIVIRNTTCPRCGGPVPNAEHPGEYMGALSRFDNETEICSACGTKEAMFNFTNPGESLPPIDQEIA